MFKPRLHWQILIALLLAALAGTLTGTEGEWLGVRFYAVFDFIRPGLADKRDVMAWYRFNSYIYANPAGQKRLSKAVLATRIADDQPLTIGGDFKWLLRRAAVRLIPTALVKPIAMAKAKIEAAARR